MNEDTFLSDSEKAKLKKDYKGKIDGEKTKLTLKNNKDQVMLNARKEIANLLGIDEKKVAPAVIENAIKVHTKIAKEDALETKYDLNCKILDLLEGGKLKQVAQSYESIHLENKENTKNLGKANKEIKKIESEDIKIALDEIIQEDLGHYQKKLKADFDKKNKIAPAKPKRETPAPKVDRTLKAQLAKALDINKNQGGP